MEMHYLDFATLFSLLALNVDIALQNRRVHGRKSSKDISMTGLLVRYVAIFVLLLKYFTLDDPVLIVGQTLIALNVTVYIVLVYKYRKTRS